MRRRGGQAGGVLLVLVLSLFAATLTWPVFAAVPQDWCGHWAEREIAYCTGRGLVKGCEDGSVRPNGMLSRAELVTLLLRSVGQEENAGTQRRMPSNFADLPVSHWAHGYIEIAVDWGLIIPDPAGRVLPGDMVTRVEMATVVSRLLDRLGLSVRAEGIPFADAVSIPASAVEAVRHLYGLGIVTGDPEGRFNPGSLVSRGEAIVLTTRVLAALGKKWDVSGVIASVDVPGRSLTLEVDGQYVRLWVSGASMVYSVAGQASVEVLQKGDRVGVVLRDGKLSQAAYIEVLRR